LVRNNPIVMTVVQWVTVVSCTPKKTNSKKFQSAHGDWKMVFQTSPPQLVKARDYWLISSIKFLMKLNPNSRTSIKKERLKNLELILKNYRNEVWFRNISLIMCSKIFSWQRYRSRARIVSSFSNQQISIKFTT
jgi:hypothetical protein